MFPEVAGEYGSLNTWFSRSLRVFLRVTYRNPHPVSVFQLLKLLLVWDPTRFQPKTELKEAPRKPKTEPSRSSKKNTKEVNEHWLFHGTTAEAATGIAENDFRSGPRVLRSFLCLTYRLLSSSFRV